MRSRLACFSVRLAYTHTLDEPIILRSKATSACINVVKDARKIFFGTRIVYSLAQSALGVRMACRVPPVTMVRRALPVPRARRVTREIHGPRVTRVRPAPPALKGLRRRKLDVEQRVQDVRGHEFVRSIPQKLIKSDGLSKYSASRRASPTRNYCKANKCAPAPPRACQPSLARQNRRCN